MANKNTMLINIGNSVEDKPDVKFYDDRVPEDIYKKLLQTSQRVGWRYGWNTPSNPEARYWHHEIGFGNKQNRECVAERVKEHPAAVFTEYQDWLLEQLPTGTKILRFYMNAYTFGTDGWPHTDTDRTGEWTSILYVTPEWKPAWAGETAIFDKKGDVEEAVLPARNRLLVFSSDRLHAPRPLARAFKGLRVVLVVKIGFENDVPPNQE